MDRSEQTKRIIWAIILVAAAIWGAYWFLIHVPAEERAAILTRDYSRCHSYECKAAISEELGRRLRNAG